MENKFKQLHKLIGNTPMLEIEYEYKGRNKKVYFKAEWYNLTGSIKDRMALSIIENAYREGKLKKGQPITEITSGNTGISMSAIGAYLGNPVLMIMPEHVSTERRDIITALGAELFLVDTKAGGYDACINLQKRLAKDSGAFIALQHGNIHNREAHFKTTGPEILNTLRRINKTPTAFVAGVGTGGTIMGTSKFLKSKLENFKAYAIEPADSPTLRVGKKVGMHKIQGLNDNFISPLVKLEKLDGIIDVYSDDAILMAKKISSDLGLGVGISAGANFLGAVLANEYENDGVVVSVFPDSNKKYYSTELFKKIEAKDDYLFNKINLLSFKVFY